MPKKIHEIRDDLLRYTAYIQDSMDRKVADKIANAVGIAVLDMVAKGISPIEGAGRFPAYKAAALRNSLKKEKSAVAKALRANKKALVRFRRMNQRQLILAHKEANRKDLSSTGRGYPFNTEQFKHGSKRPRPVNLFLTGKFLNALESHVTGTAGHFGIEIGFFDAKQAVKEQGHREGANGQPQRPIIPINREDFAQSIQNAIWKIIEEEIDRAALSGAS